EGIRRHLDHLVWLGVDAIWICPFYRSPMADFGYDVSDYCDVDPLFGTLDDFDRLLAEAHERGLRVIVDWVPNHTSDQHPWFVASRSSRDDPKRDWYIWRDGVGPGLRPNNWKAAFGGDAWTWDDATTQWYLHLFLPEQPDLDWRNPEVVAAMHDTLRFWLDRGVDGFRVDVVQGMLKDPSFPDDPPDGLLPHSAVNDCPDVHPVLRDLRALIDSYPGDRMMVGEVYLLSTRQVAAYFGRGDELHLAFDFTPLFAPWEAAAWRRQLETTLAELGPIGAWATWTLSNHDNPRHRTRYGGSEARARAAALLVLTLPGVPFLYAGEELGLEDAAVDRSRVVDPGGRDPCRAPMPWDPSPGHGWAGNDPWLPWPPEPEARNVASLAADAGSILHLYRRLVTARRATPALQTGAVEVIDGPDGLLVYVRHAGDDWRTVVVNFTTAGAAVELDGEWDVEVASDGRGEGRPFRGSVDGDTAVVLRPQG
ncbi:MAG: alpha-amylase family glycosyl hydrolase, partial [Actinomycetota bacterium]|nr:alpha-amylase family glycosyl hydrolase [Actinomycetota bacterium]